MDQKDHRIVNRVTREKEIGMINQKSTPKNLSKGHNVHRGAVPKPATVMGWQILNRDKMTGCSRNPNCNKESF